MQRRAAVDAGGLALGFPGGRWTWADFDRQVAEWTELLRPRVRRGGRVAVVSPNRPELAALFFAVARLGAAFAPLNPRLAPPELARALSILAPDVVLGERVQRARGSRATEGGEAVDLATSPSDAPRARSILGADVVLAERLQGAAAASPPGVAEARSILAPDVVLGERVRAAGGPRAREGEAEAAEFAASPPEVAGVRSLLASDVVLDERLRAAADPREREGEAEAVEFAASPAEVAGVRSVLASDVRLDAAGPRSKEGQAEVAASPQLAIGRGEGAAAEIVASLFTSGTTGAPRLVHLTRGNFEAHVAAAAELLGADPAQQWVGTLPLFHIGGLAMLARCAAWGAPLHLEPGFDARRVSELLDGPATHASLVPTTLDRLLAFREGRSFRPELGAVLIGGGPMRAAQLERARALGLPVLQTYGLTEACSQVATERPGEADGRSAGPPLPGVEVRILEPGADGVGEVAVRGPTVALATGRWLHTGDLGALDAKGRLVIHSRRVDLIVTGGENVSPLEVEAVLADHPSVEEVAVVPRADDTWGQVPVALVEGRGSVDAAALLAWGRARLAAFKLPRAVIAVPQLPRNAMGKLDRLAAARLVALGRSL